MSSKCQTIQNRGLRAIGGCFKRTPVPILHKETHIPPVELKLASLRAAYCSRRNAARLDQVILRARTKIANRLGIRRTRTGKLPDTPGQLTDRWYKDVYQRGYKLTEYPDLGLTDRAHPRDRAEEATYIDAKGVATFAKALMVGAWAAEWEVFKEKHPSFVNNTACGGAPLETQEEVLARHRGLGKQQSALALQMRTEINGFRAYLHSRRVPGIDTPFCEACLDANGQERRETARHVTQFCVRGSDERRREMWRKAGVDTWRGLMDNAKGLNAGSRWLFEIGELGQFTLAGEWLEGGGVEEDEVRRGGQL